MCLYSVFAPTTDEVGDDYDFGDDFDDRDDDGDADDGDDDDGDDDDDDGVDDDHGVSEGQARLLGGVTALPEVSFAQRRLHFGLQESM